MSALKVRREDLLEDFPVQIVSTGHSKVMIGIKNKDILDRLQPNLEQLAAISGEIQCNGYYVFTLDRGSNILVHGRMFAPAIGITEDPVTGNANGPLGAYLVHYKKVSYADSEFAFQAIQGEAIHRPGIIHVKVSIDGGEPSRVQISGNAVITFQTEIALV